MDISNALTPIRGDARYVKKLFSHEDFFDNTTNIIPLGSSTDFEHFEIEYVLQLPVSGRSHHGLVSVAVLSSVSAEIANHTYEFPDSELEIETITYSVNVNVGTVQLRVAVAGVGENPTFNYRIAAISAAD